MNYDYVFDGIHQVGETISYLTPMSQPGYVKYKDLNNDRIIDTEDMDIIGRTTPNIVFGINNTFTWKNLSFSFFINGQAGATCANTLLGTHTVSYRQNQIVKNFWTEENPNNEYPMNTGDGSENIKRVKFYRSTDFVRLKDINISYKLPSKWTDAIGLNKIEIYANAKNVYTITPWTGLDPEFTSSQRAVPQTFEMLFGIRIDI